MRRRALLGGLLAAACAPDPAPAPLRVLAAASLAEAFTAAVQLFPAAPTALSFAASSALARQIAQGAPGDLFCSADEAWMDYLQQQGLLEPGTRVRLLGNALALIAPAGSPLEVRLAPGLDLAAALGRARLAIAEPEAVPAGRYARAALQALGAWEGLEGRLALAESVRGALRLVELGEAEAAVVYRSDAIAAGARVRLVGLFPAGSHPPISYPAALLKGRAGPEARALLGFLQGREAWAVFARHGFAPPP